jgi:hypothetical protein
MRRALNTRLCFCLFGVALLPLAARADGGPPSNAELYQMILELRESQQELSAETTRAKADAAEARNELEATRLELEEARRELAHRDEAALPPVAAAEEGALVRVARHAREFSPFGEFLYMRPSGAQLDFAIIEDDEATAVGFGSEKSITPDYNTGFKVGAEFRPGDSGLDLRFAYTQLRMKESALLAPPFEPPAGPGGNLIATLSHPSFGRNATTANAKFRFDYNSADLETGQTLLLGESLELRLFGGVRYADIVEHFDADYDGIDFDNANVSSDIGYWGVGPRVGASGRWSLPYGFEIFGGAATSLLVGEAEAEVKQTDQNEAVLVTEIHRDFGVRLVPAIDLRAGIGLDRPLGEWGSLSVQVGYEFQNYFNYIEHFTFVDDSSTVNENTTDLGIDGMFVRGSVRFHGP